MSRELVRVFGGQTWTIWKKYLGLEKPLGKIEEGRIPVSPQSPSFTFLGVECRDMNGVLVPLGLMFRTCHAPSQQRTPTEAPVSQLSVSSRALPGLNFKDPL